MVIQGNDSPAAVVWNLRGLYQAVFPFAWETCLEDLLGQMLCPG